MGLPDNWIFFLISTIFLFKSFNLLSILGANGSDMIPRENLQSNLLILSTQ